MKDVGLVFVLIAIFVLVLSVIAFGDGFSDVGQKGSRYTVNNGSVNNWTLQLASHYQKTLTPVSSGGLSYAQGNARISAQPDWPPVTFLAGQPMLISTMSAPAASLSSAPIRIHSGSRPAS